MESVKYRKIMGLASAAAAFLLIFLFFAPFSAKGYSGRGIPGFDLISWIGEEYHYEHINCIFALLALIFDALVIIVGCFQMKYEKLSLLSAILYFFTGLFAILTCIKDLGVGAGSIIVLLVSISMAILNVYPTIKSWVESLK